MKLLTATIKPYKLDALMDELLEVELIEIRVADFKSYASRRGHIETYRGTERNVALIPKVQIQILAEKESLIKADEIIKKYRDEGDDGNDIAFISDVTLV